MAKLLTGALISLICIIGTMMLTTGCSSKEELYCDPGYAYLGVYSKSYTCADACSKIHTWDYVDGHCCCKK